MGIKEKFEEALGYCDNKNIHKAQTAIRAAKQCIVMKDTRDLMELYLKRKLLEILQDKNIESGAEYDGALSFTREKKVINYKQYDAGMKYLLKKEGNLAWNEFLSVADSSGGLNNAFMLGEIKYFGLGGVKADKTEAFSWYLRAANSKEDTSINKLEDAEGILLANLIVGEMYIKGDGVPANDQKASVFFERAVSIRNLELAKVIKIITESVAWAHSEKFAKGLQQYNKSSFKEAQKLFKDAAKVGDARAEYYLGLMYEQGKLEPVNMGKAANLYILAANRGYSPAMYNLAKCYQNGLGVVKNDISAAEWYQKAAALNYQSAAPAAAVPPKPLPTNVVAPLQKRFSISQMDQPIISSKTACAQEFAETLSLAQSHDDPIIHYLLASFYESGNGTKIDKEQATFWYNSALKQLEKIKTRVDQGHASAQFVYGQIYEKGQSAMLGKNEVQAALMYRQAAEHGYSRGQYSLGLMFMQGKGGLPKDYKQAEEWLQKAAAQKHADAQCELGTLKISGSGLEEKDRGLIGLLAVSLYRKAADLGSVKAQFNLGYTYQNGGPNKLLQDYALAIYWYRKAAVQGAVRAEHELKQLESSNQLAPNIEQDVKLIEEREATAGRQLELLRTQADVALIRKKAEYENAEAMYTLGTLYARGGFSLEQDTNQALSWYKKAETLDHALAKEALFELQNSAMPIKQCVLALANYTAQYPDGLSFKDGDKLELLERTGTGWLKCRLGTQVGMVPETYVEIKRVTSSADLPPPPRPGANTTSSSSPYSSFQSQKTMSSADLPLPPPPSGSPSANNSPYSSYKTMSSADLPPPPAPGQANIPATSSYKDNLDSTSSYNSATYASARNSGHYSGFFNSQASDNNASSSYADNLSSTASANYTDNLASSNNYRY